MNIFLYPNLQKPNSKKYTEQACGVLFGEDVSICMEENCRDDFGKQYDITYMPIEQCVEDCDAIVVTGGDGTILRCSKYASRYDKPILGVNCGTLGFMASLEPENIHRLRRLCRGDFTVTERMMLGVTVFCEDGSIAEADALNDVVIFKNDDCHIADFEVTKQGSLVSSLRADGVIFSTPTGSTAYSLSAGGPLIEPDLECIEFSQICAHSLFARPIIFSPKSRLEVHCRCSEGSHAHITVDGVRLMNINDRDIIRICRSELTTKIIDMTDGSFFPTVNSKLMMPIK